MGRGVRAAVIRTGDAWLAASWPLPPALLPFVRRLEGYEERTPELGYSPKHVIALFDEHVGVTPKVFARIVRLDALVRHLRAAPDEPWAKLAQRFGFFDQPHLAHEVKQMTGLTPTALRRVLFGLEVPSIDLNSLQDLHRTAR